MAEPKYNPKVADRANELIKQGYNPQKAAEQAFKENNINPDSNEAYLYVIDAVDPKKQPFLKEWTFGNNGTTEDERRLHQTIAGATSSQEQTDRTITRSNNTQTELNKSLSEESRDQIQAAAQAKQELYNSSPNATAIAASAEIQSRNVSQYSASRTVETESVRGGGTVTTRIVNTEELSKYREEEKKISAEVRAKNREIRDEILREQGIDPATATNEQKVNANVQALNQDRTVKISDEVERRLGKRPDPQYETTSTPSENSTTTRVTEAADVSLTRSNTVTDSVTGNTQISIQQVSDTTVSTSTNHAVATSLNGAQDRIPTDSQSARNIAKGNDSVATTGTAAITDPFTTEPGYEASVTSSNNTSASTDSGITAKTPSSEDSGTSTTTGQVSQRSQTNQINGQQVGKLLQDNPLDALADYTYNFTLTAIRPDIFNKIVRDKNYVYKKEHVILATGSRNNNEMPRDKNFLKDFFLTDLKFDTIVGLNSRTKGSNVISLSFKIIEPMGVSFFDRLYTMASEIGIKNYIEIPYMLIIEFKGNDDEGRPVTLNQHTKYIPIKLINAKFKVTASGSTYDVTAVPFNHVAYQATEHGSTPVNLQVTAKTVGEFFANSNNIDELAKEIVNDQRELARDIERRRAVVNNFGFEAVDSEDVKKGINRRIEESRKKFYNAASYTQAVNAFQQRLRILKQVEEPDVYTFTIDEDIAKTSIVDPKLLPANRVAFSSNASNKQQGNDSETSKQGVFAVTAGTSTVNVINMILRNSDYIKNQLTEKSQKLANSTDGVEIANAEEKPINWYKIIPTVTLEKYDNKRNTYSKVINYTIVKHIIYNTKSPLAPKSLPTKWLQEYQYIFTGKNKHIIDLDIDFNVLFFTMATADRSKWASWNSAAGIPKDRDESKGFAPSETFTPIKTLPVSSNLPLVVSSVDSDSAKGIAASDFYNTVLSSSRGDMVNVRLTIIGDPRYIKQDDIFWNPLNSPEQRTEILSKNSSVIFDYEERYVRLIFNTPVDYDSETGLLETNGKYVTSRFSGLYRIIRIENNFSRGKFDQVLELIKVFNDKEDFAKMLNEKNNRPQPVENQSAAETARLGRTGFIGENQPVTPPITQSPLAVTETSTNPKLQDFANAPTNFSDPASDPNTNFNETPSSGISDQEKLEALRKYNEENAVSNPVIATEPNAPQPTGFVPIDHVKAYEQAVASSEKYIAETEALERKLSDEFNSPPSRRDVGRELKAAQESGADPATIAQLQQKFETVAAEKAAIADEQQQATQRLAGLRAGLEGNRDRLNEAKLKANQLRPPTTSRPVQEDKA